MPVGEGTQLRHDFLCSRSVKSTPSTAPTVNETFIQESRAAASAVMVPLPESSCVTIFAKPTHRWEVGVESWALSPGRPMPYVSRSCGYIQASVSAPNGTARSCMYVRTRGVERTMYPTL